MRLADDIAPGTFRFYCVIHFPFMQGELEVVPDDESVMSQPAWGDATARRERQRSRPQQEGSMREPAVLCLDQTAMGHRSLLQAADQVIMEVAHQQHARLLIASRWLPA